MSVEALSFLCNHLPSKIKKLSLSHIFAVNSKDYILEDEHVIAVTNRCPELEELDLGGRQENFISEGALAAIIEKLQNLVKLKLPDTDQIQFVKLLELRTMPNLKYLYVHVEMDLADLFEHFPLDESLPLNVDEQIDDLKRETPLIKALVKNLPNASV